MSGRPVEERAEVGVQNVQARKGQLAQASAIRSLLDGRSNRHVSPLPSLYSHHPFSSRVPPTPLKPFSINDISLLSSPFFNFS